MAAHRRGRDARLAAPCCDQMCWGGSMDQPRSIAETSITKRFPVSCAGGGAGISMLFFGIRPSSPDHTYMHTPIAQSNCGPPVAIRPPPCSAAQCDASHIYQVVALWQEHDKHDVDDATLAQACRHPGQVLTGSAW